MNVLNLPKQNTPEPQHRTVYTYFTSLFSSLLSILKPLEHKTMNFSIMSICTRILARKQRFKRRFSREVKRNKIVKTCEEFNGDVLKSECDTRRATSVSSDLPAEATSGCVTNRCKR